MKRFKLHRLIGQLAFKVDFGFERMFWIYYSFKYLELKCFVDENYLFTIMATDNIHFSI